LIGGNRNSTAYYFKRLCEIFVHQLDQESHEVFADEIEVDESYFGGTRIGKRGRDSAGKVPVFGL
jgi:transposase